MQHEYPWVRNQTSAMANAYIHNSVLTDDQVQSIMRSYAGFAAPKDAAKAVGVSRQTTHSLYLKFSQSLHAAHRWEGPTQDAARQDIYRWMAGREIQAAYGLYLEGPDIEDYRLTRQGNMLSPEEYGPYVVARELRERWGKISEKAFVYHYALIQRTVDCRIGWMRFFGTDDISAPNVVMLAATQLCKGLEGKLRPQSPRASNLQT
jgi:uncharacterized protein YfiM (DUF2279 family)